MKKGYNETGDTMAFFCSVGSRNTVLTLAHDGLLFQEHRYQYNSGGIYNRGCGEVQPLRDSASSRLK